MNFIQWFKEKVSFYIKERKLPPWPYRYRNLQPSLSNLRRITNKNNPLPIFLKKFRGSKDKITIINKWAYWMDYLENVLLTDDRFILRSCSQTSSSDDSIQNFNINDPETLNIVIGGKNFYSYEHSKEFFFTKHHRVLVRIQHSPGFGLISFIDSYDWVKNNGFKLMIPKKHWDFILKSDTFPDRVLKIREEIINDGVPLAFIHFDPKLNRIFNSPKKVERKPGTVFISCNFRIADGIADSNADIKRLLTAIDYLSKNLKITTANLHPITKEHLKSLKQPESLLLGALQNSNVKNITTQNTIQDMVNLYDEHEFIVTDGSGTVYEAIARGCKALTLDGLSYQTNKDKFHHTAELGLLPKTLVWDYKGHHGAEMDMEWLKSLFPTSLVKEDVTPLVAQEMVDVFNNWHR